MRTGNLGIAGIGKAQAMAGTIGITRGALADAARYTGMALVGGYDVRTGKYFSGALDPETRKVINWDLMPNMMSPAIAWSLGLTEQERVNLGYQPEAPYKLQRPTSGGGGGGGGGGGYGYGGYGDGGYGAAADRYGADTLDLMMWRF